MPSMNLSKKEAERLLKKIQISAMSEEDKRLERKLRRHIRPIKTSSAKGKGRALQQWIAREIADLLGLEYNQQDDQCLIHSREMGQSGVDVILRGEAFQRFPFAIECKSGESFQLVKTVDQARNNQGEASSWLIVHRRKAWKEPIAILPWEGFKKLFKGDIIGVHRR